MTVAGLNAGGRAAKAVYDELVATDEKVCPYALSEHRQVEDGRYFQKHVLCTDRRIVMVAINGTELSITVETYPLRSIRRLDRYTVLEESGCAAAVDRVIIYFNDEDPIELK